LYGTSNQCEEYIELSISKSELHHNHDRDLFETEFQDEINAVMADTNSTIEKVKAIMEQKTISKTALKEVVSVLEKIQRDVNSNMPFIAKSFNEHLDKSVSSAKIEMEAFVENKIRSAGLEALRNNAPSIAIEKKDQ